MTADYVPWHGTKCAIIETWEFIIFVIYNLLIFMNNANF